MPFWPKSAIPPLLDQHADRIAVKIGIWTRRRAAIDVDAGAAAADAKRIARDVAWPEPTTRTPVGLFSQLGVGERHRAAHDVQTDHELSWMVTPSNMTPVGPVLPGRVRRRGCGLVAVERHAVDKDARKRGGIQRSSDRRRCREL